LTAAGGLSLSSQRTRLVEAAHFVVVSSYLAVVLVFLLLTGRVDPQVSVRRLVAARLRPRARGTLTDFGHEGGHCYTSPLPAALVSDADGRSRIQLYEDGKPLGPAHCTHDEIRTEGAGRFSHWGAQVYFSTSDNTSPFENGRTYSYDEP